MRLELCYVRKLKFIPFRGVVILSRQTRDQNSLPETEKGEHLMLQRCVCAPIRRNLNDVNMLQSYSCYHQRLAGGLARR